MTWWHRLWHRGQMEDELDKELRFHLDQHTTDLIAQGYDPEEARRRARLALGGVEQAKEECRDARGTRWLEDLMQDVRYGLRTLWRKPGFAAVTVLTLALGIGAVTAIFSAVNPILFRSLPYPDAGRIMMIWDTGDAGARLDATFGTYRELVERNRSLDAIAVMKPWQPTMTGPAEPERFDGQRVSASYFRVLGVPPALGRDFDSSQDRLAGPKVAILSHGLWQRRFGGDPEIIGRAITLDDDGYTVIGVMPRAFENVLGPSAELWSPLQYDISIDRAWGHHLRMVGRVRPDVATDRARSDLDRIALTPVPEFPRPAWAAVKQGFIVRSLQDDITGGIRPALLAVLGAVILVLTIACVNVTNLLLARGAQRRAEFALRVALGAGRARVIRQLLAETLILALLGGALGILVAQLGVDALVALSPPELPRANEIEVDSAVLVFALGATTVIGLIVGLVPALHASRGELRLGMQRSSQSVAGGHQRTRRTLVVAEVALALVLLVSAGLLLRSLQRLFAVAPGFDAADVLAMQVQTSGHRFDDDSTTRRFFEQALEAVRRVPGVAGAAFTSQLPLSGDVDVYGVQFEMGPVDRRQGNQAFRYAVSPGYFETVGIPLRRGRRLDAHDATGAPVAVTINESFAKRHFRDRDPIGQHLHIGPNDGPWATIVGVVGDVKQTSLAVSQSDAVYIPTAQWRFTDKVLWLVVRAPGAAALAPAIKEAIWSVDKDQAIVRVAALENLVAASAAQRRFALILFEAFALAALVLSATGIYGVLSGSVTERTREIGVRSALGASRGEIVALVIRQAMTLTGLGVVVGLAGAALASRALITLLFGVSQLDPVTYLGVIALLFAVSGIACWVPAWRAARVDPAITLRAE